LHPVAGHRLFLLRIGLVEVASAFHRRRREGALTEGETADLVAAFLADCAMQHDVVEVTPEVVGEAIALLGAHPLALDAVQLAAASRTHRQELGTGLSPLTFVAADDRLCAVASALGMPVENPNGHP
jgi:hypothetical protein